MPGTRALAYLTSDAHLMNVRALGLDVDFAIQAGGLIRTPLMAGATGAITVADAFRVVPLGKSPFDETVGYPLVRAKVAIDAIRILFEFTSGRGPYSSSYDLTGGALVADMDCSRDPVTSVADAFNPAKGRVMKIWMDSDPSDGLEQFDQLVWDRDDAPPLLGGTKYAMVTTSYIAQIMADGGIALLDMDEQPVEVDDAVIRRSDGTEFKELESFFAFLDAEGTVPARYDEQAAEATSRFERMAFCP